MLEVEKALQSFGRGVVKQARANLTRQGKRSSNGLYRSLKSNVEKFPNSFSLEFKSTDYADFVDRGVSGKEKKYNTPFSFKNKMPPKEPIKKWIKQKRLYLRDEKGRFKKGGIDSLSFLIQRSIYKKGLRPSLYFTRAFETQYKKLPKELLEAYGLDLDDFLEYTFQDNYKK